MQVLGSSRLAVPAEGCRSSPVPHLFGVHRSDGPFHQLPRLVAGQCGCRCRLTAAACLRTAWRRLAGCARRRCCRQWRCFCLGRSCSRLFRLGDKGELEALAGRVCTQHPALHHCRQPAWRRGGRATSREWRCRAEQGHGLLWGILGPAGNRRNRGHSRHHRVQAQHGATAEETGGGAPCPAWNASGGFWSAASPHSLTCARPAGGWWCPQGALEQEHAHKPSDAPRGLELPCRPLQPSLLAAPCTHL